MNSQSTPSSISAPAPASTPARRARFVPPPQARHPRVTVASSVPVSPPAPAPVPAVAHDDALDADDIEAYEFEAAVIARAGPAALSVPTRRSLRVRSRAPLPLSGLRALDAHAWAQEPALLAMWARGAGVGACANSVTDAMFAPGSPPRMRPRALTTAHYY